MHLHIGLAAGLAAFGTVLFFGTLWRITSMMLRNTVWGQAMAFMY